MSGMNRMGGVVASNVTVVVASDVTVVVASAGRIGCTALRVWRHHVGTKSSWSLDLSRIWHTSYLSPIGMANFTTGFACHCWRLLMCSAYIDGWLRTTMVDDSVGQQRHTTTMYDNDVRQQCTTMTYDNNVQKWCMYDNDVWQQRLTTMYNNGIGQQCISMTYNTGKQQRWTTTLDDKGGQWQWLGGRWYWILNYLKHVIELISLQTQ